MLKSKSLSDLIYQTNIKPVYYNIKLQNPIIIDKPISYGEFLIKNPNCTKNERKEAIRLFYEKLLK
jgi:hypothetical protein